MRFVIQRVSEASVTVEGKCVGAIDNGFLVLVGISKEDDRETVDKFIKKMTGLRIFQDTNHKTNLSLQDVNGQVLMVSQFTLYANCKKGNRPSFFEAGEPEAANELFSYAVEKTKEYVPIVKTGIFGAKMEISLVNDGPFTVILDEKTFH